MGSTRLRGSEGQWFKSPLVTLKPVRWFKGRSSAKRLRVHYLSDDSCAFGGVGGAPDGDAGELFLLFNRSGPPEPRNVLYTFSQDVVLTPSSRDAFSF